MGHEQLSDVWASGQAYEPYVGRWSRQVAKQFLSWLDVPPGRRWLDVGCGTGALTETFLSIARPAAVTSVDPSAEFVDFARSQIADQRVTFQVGGGEALPVESARYDVVVSGLVLNFIADHPRAMSEMKRAACPGGLVALYVWDYASGMQMLRYFWNAAVTLDPTAEEFDEGSRFAICQPEPLRQLFVDAHFGDIEIRAIDIPTVFRDFDDYWSPFLGGQGAAPAYAMSLPEDKRAMLRDEIRQNLPTRADGSIHLNARAWTAKGRRAS